MTTLVFVETTVPCAIELVHNALGWTRKERREQQHSLLIHARKPILMHINPKKTVLQWLPGVFAADLNTSVNNTSGADTRVITPRM